MPAPPTPKFHEPVLVEAVLDLLRPGAGTLVDCTLGAGGHARALAGRAAGARLLGIDADPAAVAEAGRRLSDLIDKREVFVRHDDYVRLVAIVDELELKPVMGVLLDLGASWHQLRTPGRGFGFAAEGPLDMRFDPGKGPTAGELIARAPVGEIERWLREYGEEPFARRIARRIDENRPALGTTADLAMLVRRSVPRARQRRTLARVFQALRIRVNDELAKVRAGIEAAIEVLAPGGRLVVISYHSLEDRIVKTRFRAGAQAGELVVLTRRPVRPGAAEAARNPAARSAKLRAAEKAG
ncbi:16S rRNA (cytosine(1402)-N(4))-methyltransferase RsmH [candidate division WOR-3 bacterium]|nr:16S rRNA (cytosine(1402)-N(4))-methyltransferase RsmH [candidate division WOR-3 bacterium]